MPVFFMWLANLIGGPIVSGLIKAYSAKLQAENTSEKTAADLAARELDVQKREAELRTQTRIAMIGHPLEPEMLLGYIMVLYFGKVVIWDKVLGDLTHGRTDPLTGDIAVWAGMVMAAYIGKRGIENVTRIYKGR
jgi:hypothetical protein